LESSISTKYLDASSDVRRGVVLDDNGEPAENPSTATPFQTMAIPKETDAAFFNILRVFVSFLSFFRVYTKWYQMPLVVVLVAAMAATVAMLFHRIPIL
jgi:hypothetical protein